MTGNYVTVRREPRSRVNWRTEWFPIYSSLGCIVCGRSSLLIRVFKNIFSSLVNIVREMRVGGGVGCNWSPSLWHSSTAKRPSKQAKGVVL
jgi:hypothetical protein